MSTKRAPAPPSRPASRRSPSIRRASSRPIASPSPKPLSPPSRAPARSGRRRVRGPPRATPGPVSATLTVACRSAAPTTTRTAAPAGEKRSALSSRIRTICATAPGSAAAQQCPARSARSAPRRPPHAGRTPRSRRGTCRRARAPRAAAAAPRRAGRDRAASRRAGQAIGLALRGRRLLARVREVRRVGLELLAQQPEHQPQRRERRAQLVRRRRHERPPRLLLLAQLAAASARTRARDRRSRPALGSASSGVSGPMFCAALSRSMPSRRTSRRESSSPVPTASTMPTIAATISPCATTPAVPAIARSGRRTISAYEARSPTTGTAASASAPSPEPLTWRTALRSRTARVAIGNLLARDRRRRSPPARGPSRPRR